MNEQITKVLKTFKPLVQLIRKHLIVALVIVFALIYLTMIYKIRQLADSQPSQSTVSNHLTAISQPKVDPKILTKIQQLQNNNIQVQTLFEQARNNPFSE